MATSWFEFNYVYLLPLFLGFYRWGMYLILKIIPAMFYKPMPLNYKYKGENPVNISKKDVSMIIPVYMPEPGFDECVLSWIKSNPKNIIIVADKVKGYKEVCNMVEKNG